MLCGHGTASSDSRVELAALLLVLMLFRGSILMESGSMTDEISMMLIALCLSGVDLAIDWSDSD